MSDVIFNLFMNFMSAAVPVVIIVGSIKILLIPDWNIGRYIVWSLVLTVALAKLYNALPILAADIAP